MLRLSIRVDRPARVAVHIVEAESVCILCQSQTQSSGIRVDAFRAVDADDANLSYEYESYIEMRVALTPSCNSIHSSRDLQI